MNDPIQGPWPRQIIIEQVFASTQDLHEILRDALRFPDHYGKNLDALWDCLTTEIDQPTHLTWRNFAATKKHLGPAAEAIRQVLEEAAAENPHLTLEVKQ